MIPFAKRHPRVYMSARAVLSIVVGVGLITAAGAVFCGVFAGLGKLVQYMGLFPHEDLFTVGSLCIVITIAITGLLAIAYLIGQSALNRR